jgi:aspartate/glutamate racemase
MRRIGLLGGMSWQSTVSYRYINGKPTHVSGTALRHLVIWSGD